MKFTFLRILPVAVILSLTKATSTILDVVVNVANKDLDLRKVTIVTWRYDHEVLHEFLKKFNGSVITLNLNNNHVDVQCEQYVFFAATAVEYYYFIHFIKDDQIFPVRVILVLLEPRISRESLQIITRTSLKMDISDLAIIYGKEDKDVKITTYFPLTKETCENYEPVTFNASEVVNYFPRKYKNFFGCPLRVSLLDWPPYVVLHRSNGTIVSVTGTEGRLVQILVEKLNASLKTVFAKDAENFGVLSSYGHWTGTMGDIMYGRADISATSAIINLDRFRAVQITHSYKILRIIWCAPNQIEVRAWARVLRPLFTNFTFLFGMSCMSLVVVYACIQKYQFRKNISKPTLFYSWAIFLGQAVKFETVNWLLNSLFVIWMWVCLILRIAFQGKLVKDLEKVITEEPFKTFADANKYIENYGGSNSIITFYADTPVAKNFKPLSSTEIREKADSISRGERFLLAIDLWTLRQFVTNIQILDEPVVISPVSILVRRRWAASREFDLFLLRIVESGIYNKIVEDYVAQNILKNYKKYTTHDLHFTPLDMLHLSGCFYGLMIGQVLCCSLLGLENVWFKWNQTSLKK